ncbi:hypothetical protein [Alteromonas sp. C1M14]|uniref:hypothetical protein n=1 Tax=Alteromonas sp. C1M14 TaxID=2841567 RepID=UPI001C0A1410|nr:hypothetical protein [Alteromonas sp. C1M14]MBU2978569.1 hypothetical protein [Alteromonas sp. C1M14]
MQTLTTVEMQSVSGGSDTIAWGIPGASWGRWVGLAGLAVGASVGAVGGPAGILIGGLIGGMLGTLGGTYSALAMYT